MSFNFCETMYIKQKNLAENFEFQWQCNYINYCLLQHPPTHTHTRPHTHTHTRTHTQLATMAIPYHLDFMVLLGSDRSDESVQQVVQDMGIFAQNLREICVILDQFLVRKNIETES